MFINQEIFLISSLHTNLKKDKELKLSENYCARWKNISRSTKINQREKDFLLWTKIIWLGKLILQSLIFRKIVLCAD